MRNTTSNNTKGGGTGREHRTTERKRTVVPAEAQGPQQHKPTRPTAQDTPAQSTAQPEHKGTEKKRVEGGKKNKKKPAEKKTRKGGEGKKKRGRGAQDAKAEGTQGREIRNAGDKGARKKKKQKKRKKTKSTRTTRSRATPAPSWPSRQGEHQERPQEKVRRTKTRLGGRPAEGGQEGTHTHAQARDPGVASSEPERGGVGVDTKQPRCTGRPPVERRTVRETGRVSDRVHTLTPRQRTQPKTDAGGTRSGQLHRGALNR